MWTKKKLTILESEYQPYIQDDLLCIINTMVLHYTEECDDACSTGLIQKTNELRAGLVKIKQKAPARNGMVLVYRPNEVGQLVQKYESIRALSANFIKFAYTGTLFTDGGMLKPENFASTLSKEWKERHSKHFHSWGSGNWQINSTKDPGSSLRKGKRFSGADEWGPNGSVVVYHFQSESGKQRKQQPSSCLY
jgi:hypothetical protein